MNDYIKTCGIFADVLVGLKDKGIMHDGNIDTINSVVAVRALTTAINGAMPEYSPTGSAFVEYVKEAQDALLKNLIDGKNLSSHETTDCSGCDLENNILILLDVMKICTRYIKLVKNPNMFDLDSLADTDVKIISTFEKVQILCHCEAIAEMSNDKVNQTIREYAKLCNDNMTSTMIDPSAPTDEYYRYVENLRTCSNRMIVYQKVIKILLQYLNACVD